MAAAERRACRVKISACIIAKDEADRIGPCLDSVSFCDEIVVLDSGSRDGTVALCRSKGARVLETDWPGWIAQKNRAVDAARHDWILSLDADERVDPALRAAVEALRDARSGEEPEGPVAYEVTRLNRYLGRWIRHGGWYPEWRIRLFDRRHARWGGVDPHDRVEVRGRLGRLRDGNLLHHSYRSLADHVRQMDRFTGVSAGEMLARGRRPGLWGLCVRPPFHAFRMYVLRRGFLDGWPGFVSATMFGWYVFLKYAKAWELQREERRPTTGLEVVLPADPGGPRGFRRTDFPERRLVAALDAHDAALGAVDGASVLKQGRKTRVTRGDGVVVKEARPAGAGGRIKDRLAPRRHGAGFWGARRLEAAGVATATPLAWVRRNGRSLTIYEDLSALARLDHHARAIYRDGTRAARVRLREATAAWLGTLHRRGIYHGDLKAVNVLVRDGEPPTFPLIDTDRVRRLPAPVDRRRRVKNLAQLAASIPVVVTRAERLRWLREYTRHLGQDEDERALVRDVLREVAKKIVVVDAPIE